MPYVEPEHFGESPTALVYVAGDTTEAKDIERALSENEIAYTLVPTPFLRSSIMSGLVELPGVGFTVLAQDAEKSRSLLHSLKFIKGLVLAGEE
jgi:hypothetical protein